MSQLWCYVMREETGETLGRKIKIFQTSDFTNKGFEHSKDYGRYLEQRVVGEVEQSRNRYLMDILIIQI